MTNVFLVAADLLREAASRRWFLALGVIVSAVLLVIALGLRLEVLDGALAASKLFGWAMGTDIRSVDVAMRPVFVAASYLVSYPGMLLMILACADFAPGLLAPGRIEHLLSLPIRRWELLLGTFVGVWTIATIAAVYGAGGLTVILGVKTGAWTWGPLQSAALAAASFATLYAAMLTTAIFVRSPAISAAVGGLLFVAGTVASYRHAASELFGEGLGRAAFLLAASVLPRVGSIADAAANLAGAEGLAPGALVRLVAGMGTFTLAMLAIGLWRFEERDF